MDHMLETQQYFVCAARGENVSPLSPNPPELLGDDPVADFEQGRSEILSTFREDGVIEKTAPSLGFASATSCCAAETWPATEQDATLSEGLPEAAYETIHGRLTSEQRQGVFKPEVAVAANASAQDKLLA